MLLHGATFEAQKALEVGLVYEIVESRALETRVSEFARELCESNSAQSMQATKKMFAEIANLPLEEALEYAINANAKTRESDDCRKGIGAFLAKEKITW